MTTDTEYATYYPLDNLRTLRNHVRMGQIRIEIPADLHRALKARAALEGVTVRELLIRLLSEALDKGAPHA